MKIFAKGIVVSVAVMATSQTFAFDLFDVIAPPGLGNIARGVFNGPAPQAPIFQGQFPQGPFQQGPVFQGPFQQGPIFQQQFPPMPLPLPMLLPPIFWHR